MEKRTVNSLRAKTNTGDQLFRIMQGTEIKLGFQEKVYSSYGSKAPEIWNLKDRWRKLTNRQAGNLLSNITKRLQESHSFFVVTLIARRVRGGALVERSSTHLKVPGSNPDWCGQRCADETNQIETTIQVCLRVTQKLEYPVCASLVWRARGGAAVERSRAKLKIQGSNPGQALPMRPYEQNQLSKPGLILPVTRRFKWACASLNGPMYRTHAHLSDYSWYGPNKNIGSQVSECGART